MKLYNSRTRQIEEFKSLTPGVVKMYSCGPTVYDFVTIGNLRSFTFADLLKKSLEFLGYKVEHVMNITDFGHLVGDADDTEDKMSVGLRREGLERSIEGMMKLATMYTDYFKTDIVKMNFELANHYPRASDFIDEYVELIKTLDEKGFVYKTSDGLYFDTIKDSHYGEIINLDRSKESISRIETNSEKRNKEDFALFKFSNDLGFQTELGFGFPGWHIECSGMAKKFLGISFDIHTGGIDNLLHHCNEIAQSENANEQIYSTFFCHGEHMKINSETMSKSKKNGLKLSDLEEQGYSPLSYRYFLLQSHYRKHANFTWESLDAAQNALVKMQKAVANFNHTNTRELDENYMSEFTKCLEDDLNMPEALATLWKLLKDSNVSENKKYWSALQMDSVLSLSLGKSIPTLSPEIQKLIDLRKQYRAEKNWAEADRIRDELKSLGYTANDK